MRDTIFISHRAVDYEVADMIKDFLVVSGIPNDRVFCSSLPGNDVNEKIGPEVRDSLKRAAINILILSRDYYKSAYCLNEAGVAWYLDDVVVIPIGMPEIDNNSMIGFVGPDYKLRRLNNGADISYLYDIAKQKVGGGDASHSVIARETKKLKKRYREHLKRRVLSEAENTCASSDKIPNLQAEKEELKARLAELGQDADTSEYDDDIWEDGYHEVKNGDGQLLAKGEFVGGNLIDGIEFNVVLRIAKGEEDYEEPVPYEELKDEGWHYSECGQYDGFFGLMIARNLILEEGFQYYYVVDKRVHLEGKLVRPTFTHFRTMESFLATVEPDELEYLKTGVRPYSQMDEADIEL